MGLLEGVNWIPASSLYTRDWQPKPAAKAYQELIFDTWWTEAAHSLNSDGNWELPAFYGRYQITVDGESREVFLSKDKGAVSIDFAQ